MRARCPPSDGSVRSAPHHQRHPPGGTDPECRHPLQLTERDPALSRNRWRRHRWCWSGWRRRRWRVGCWRGRHDGRRAAAHTSQACGRWTEGAVSVEYMYAQPAVATGQGPLLLLACHVCGGGCWRRPAVCWLTAHPIRNPPLVVARRSTAAAAASAAACWPAASTAALPAAADAGCGARRASRRGCRVCCCACCCCGCLAALDWLRCLPPP